VLLLGLCAAWPFRRPSRPDLRPPPAAIALDIALRLPDATLETRPQAGQSPAAQDVRPAVTEQLTVSPVGLQNLVPPPDLPVSFRASSESEVLTPAQAATGPPPPRPQSRPYRLRDGDTLERLAERFLGDRGRAREIYEANRGQLTRPDLLPVGTTIMIPPRARSDELEPAREVQ
jgi:nucleoid-associated protein YgaU